MNERMNQPRYRWTPAVEKGTPTPFHIQADRYDSTYIPDCSNGRVGACIGLLWNDHLNIQPVLDVLHGEPSFANDQAHLVVRHEHMQRGGGGVVQLLHLLLLVAQGHEDLYLRGVHSFFVICADR